MRFECISTKQRQRYIISFLMLALMNLPLLIDSIVDIVNSGIPIEQQEKQEYVTR
jgi:hypothetical protein